MEQLTIYQKLALEGEVAEMLKAATSDPAVLYSIYYAVSNTPADVSSYIVEIARELITLPEDKLDRVLLEASLGEFPEWLWLDKVVADLKVAYNTCLLDQAPVARIHLDKNLMKQSIVKSAFVRYIRSIAVLSKRMAIKACERILEDRELAYLKSTCFSMVNEVAEFEDTEEEKDLNKLFEIKIDCRFGLLSYMEETKILKKLRMFEENPEQFEKEMEKEEAKKKELAAKAKALNEMSIAFKKSQLELINSLKDTPQEVTYTVSKMFKGHPQASVLKEFKTKEEAESFVKSMEDKFPELLNTCTFIITEKGAKKE